MTPRQYGQLLLRRWYVALALLLITGAVAVFLPRGPQVYWTRATVVFVPPVSPRQVGNVLEGSDPSLVYFAAAVERTVNGGRHTAGLSSSAATLYGSGVRQGHSVTLINSGGQWMTNFNRPMLSVEVVDSSAEETQLELNQLVALIDDTALAMQRDAGSREASLIHTELSPSVPAISLVSGNDKRAAAAVLLLGTGLSLACTLYADRLLGRRRRPVPAPQRAAAHSV